MASTISCFDPVFELFWTAKRADAYFFNRLGSSVNFARMEYSDVRIRQAGYFRLYER